MKKKDYIWFAALIGLLFAWPYLDRHVIQPTFFKQAAQPLSPVISNATETVEAPRSAGTGTVVETALVAAPASAATSTPAMVAAGPASAEPPSSQPEQRVQLRNQVATLDFSSRGAGLAAVTLGDYRSQLAKDSPAIVLDFSARRALAYTGVPGLGEEQDFQLTAESGGRKLVAERRNGQGLRLVRTIELGDRYLLNITDEFVNDSAAPLALSDFAIQTGPMQRELGHRDAAGFVTLGVDSLSPGGEDVMHWGSKLAKQFELEREARSLAKLPVRIDRRPEMKSEAVDWVAAKNKYFVQILTPDEGAASLTLHAARELAPAEVADPLYSPKMQPLHEVAVSANFEGQELSPGARVTHRYRYYVGPKKLSDLSQMPLHQDEVMEVGDWLKPVSKVLVWMLNAIHGVLPNYGVAIMLLTVIIRIVFWPLTHKSSQSMKRMAELQPLVKELQEKYKKDPQRMQAEMMRLYKEHKVNPVAGCLPMLIQIPIFFSLFMVLRSAIELRFAPFLWISDLSEPENLLVGLIGFPLNILPLLMAGTMYWQQKITPTAGDPQQAKMMRVMMTGMMLFFLYTYASGLALYWTTQNLLMIVQQYWMLRKKGPAKS